MKKDKDRGVDVGTILRDLVRRIDPDTQLHAFEAWTFWNEIVGDVLARRAQPSGYRNGVLFVTVGAHAWMQELQFMKAALRDRLNTRLGSELIRDIEFVSGAVELPPATTEPPRAVASDSEAHLMAALPELSDPQLAATFRRLVRAHARRGRRPKKPSNE